MPTPVVVVLVAVVAVILIVGAVTIFSGGDEAAGPPVTVDKDLDPELLPDAEGPSSSTPAPDESTVPPSGSEPPSSAGVPPDGPAWRTYTASDGSYRVDFPGAPTSQIPRDVEGVVSGRETLYEEDRVFYAVFAYQAQAGVFEGASDPRDVVLSIVDALDADAGITVRERSLSEFQGLPAVDFTGSGRGYFIDGTGVVAGDRVYLLIAGGIAGEHDFERFRSSFSLAT